jgi:hypothetical protein
MPSNHGFRPNPLSTRHVVRSSAEWRAGRRTRKVMWRKTKSRTGSYDSILFVRKLDTFYFDRDSGRVVTILGYPTLRIAAWS